MLEALHFFFFYKSVTLQSDQRLKNVCFVSFGGYDINEQMRGMQE